MNMIFTGGTLVCPERGVRDGDLTIVGDTIASEASNAERIDISGKLLAPAIVDLGVFGIDGTRAGLRFGCGELGYGMFRGCGWKEGGMPRPWPGPLRN